MGNGSEYVHGRSRSCSVDDCLLDDEIMRLRRSNDKLRNDLVMLSSQISENQEKQEKETEALQSKFEQWKSSARIAVEQQQAFLRTFLAAVAHASSMTMSVRRRNHSAERSQRGTSIRGPHSQTKVSV